MNKTSKQSELLDETKRFEFEVAKHNDELALARRKIEIEEKNSRRLSSGALTVIGGVVALVSAAATASIGGIANYFATTASKQTELNIKKTEVDGLIANQKLTAEAERDRLLRQQEFEIIVQATKGLSQESAAENLLFYVKAGILEDKNGDIQALAKKGKAPISTSDGKSNPLLRIVKAEQSDPSPKAESNQPYISGGVLFGEGQIDVDYVPAANFSLGNDPKYLIINYTSGGNIQKTISFLSKNVARSSAHVVIGRNGRITQMVPFNFVAWHAGSSRWKELKGLNKHSIGIELANWGMLESSAGKTLSWTGVEIPGSRVVAHPHKHTPQKVRKWEKFPPAQLKSLKIVLETLHRDIPGLLDVLGNDDISPGRKIDPGPAFPMEEMREHLFGRREAL